MSTLLRKHGRALAWGGVTVLILAALIFGASALSNPDAPTSQPSPAEQEQLVEQAEDALASGDTTTAAALAEQALAIDPADADARTVLQSAASAASASPSGAEAQPDGGANSPAVDEGGSSNGAVAEQDDPAFLEEIADIAALLPKDFEGYSMGEAAQLSSKNVDVSAVPEQLGMPAFRIAWGIRDRGTAGKAESYLTKTSEVLYPKNAAEVTVDGTTAYFGTDGSELITVTYRRGRYVFEVVVVAEKRGKPEKLRALAVEAARAFADEPTLANGE